MKYIDEAQRPKNRIEIKVTMADKKVVHIVVIPFPAQSHVNQMLDFSKWLASNHDQLKITFITIPSKITKSTPQIPLHNSITIESISDGSEQIQEPETTADLFKRFRSVVSRNLIEFIEQQKGSIFPPKIVIYSSVLPWILDIAHEQNMLGASFFTQSCGVSSVYYHMKNGALKFPYEESSVTLPFMPTLEISDLPSFKEVVDSDQSTMRLVTEQFSNLENVDFVLFNTFEKLEIEVVSWMANRWPIKTIGPANLLLAQKHENHFDAKNYKASTEWLDERETSSVVYVSLGSLVSLKEEQMEELAHGLIMSKCYFLWVVRAEEVHKLPPNFTSLVSEKGLVVDWCSQTQVLSHRSVSCFLTHCGWNSTIEALSYGVPLIAMAHWVDQTTNSKFIEDVWGVGIRVARGENKIVSREEIAVCVKEVSEGEKGKELRKNAGKWKRLANEAVGNGGTSAVNIEDFVSTILGGSN